ncbi:MAG: C2H2-type zinc finger protein [Chloroflexi bacterium]|nr:MAG: C2H2-type zinc finger protein [Chloroflexota bacterium]TMG35230.1 MAG: C2H2-type zinc finger protein [Chloroflexota bacterium]
MDKPDESTSLKGEGEKVAAAGGVERTGLECPTCGDRFPSADALEEHKPIHKIA